MEVTPIAHIYNDYTAKFGIPRQSGLVNNESVIVFEPKYQNPDALRGLEDYSHLWLIWNFSEVHQEDWSPTVRPPRLGGNVRKGVFATRSPFRPNPIGLSSVTLEGVEQIPDHGWVIRVSGADLMNGTPILDIKPYLPYVDCHPEAKGGFSDQFKDYRLKVEIPEELKKQIPEDKLQDLIQVLSQDPRPSYQKDPERIYGFTYAQMEVRFQVKGQILTVQSVDKPGTSPQLSTGK